MYAVMRINEMQTMEQQSQTKTQSNGLQNESALDYNTASELPMLLRAV